MELRVIPTEITTKIAQQIGLTFVSEKEAEGNVCMANSCEVRPEFRETFSAIDVFDYLNSVLHSLTNQEKHMELWKLDFLKIPLPKDSKIFWEMVAFGSQIRQTHLLEKLEIEGDITEFSIDGNYIVGKPSGKKSHH